MFLKISQYRNKGKHLCWNNFIKKRPQHKCFPTNIVKFLRITFFRTALVVISGHLHYFLISFWFSIFPFFFLFSSPIVIEWHVFFPSVLIFLVNMITSIQKKKCHINKKRCVSSQFRQNFDRLLCSTSTRTRTACPFALKFCTEFQETLT